MASFRRPPFVLTPFEGVALDEEGKTRRFRVPPELLEDGGGSQRRSGIRQSPAGAGPGTLEPPGTSLAGNHLRGSMPVPSPGSPSRARSPFGSRADQGASTVSPPAVTPLPPPLPRAAVPPMAAAPQPCIPLSVIGLLLKTLQEQLGPAAPWLLKQELLRRGCLPSTVPLGQLGTLVDELARHLDSPEARERFCSLLAAHVRADSQLRFATDSEKGRGKR